jgi:multiple sugar transport system permease protein
MDTFIPLIIPEIASPIVFYYMIKYMESTLPMSLVEAARIDGASEIFVFNRIVLPLMRPAFAVQMIFKFVESWNNYFIPALILHEDNKKTMPIVISLLRSANFANYDNGLIYMVIAFSILPSIIIYLFLSRLIISGITSGGIKG